MADGWFTTSTPQWGFSLDKLGEDYRHPYAPNYVIRPNDGGSDASLQLAFLSGSEGAMPDIPLGVANAIAANVIATDAIAEDIAWLFTANNGQEISLDDATLLDFCEPTHSPTSQVSGASFLDPSALESEVPDTRGKRPRKKR